MNTKKAALVKVSEVSIDGDENEFKLTVDGRVYSGSLHEYYAMKSHEVEDWEISDDQEESLFITTYDGSINCEESLLDMAKEVLKCLGFKTTSEIEVICDF